MATITFEIGNLVWAKLKPFAPWPAKIVEPVPDVKPISDKKPKQCVFFFGTENYAWIPEDLIWPYVEHRDEFIQASARPTPSFSSAVEKIEALIGGNSLISTGDSIQESSATSVRAAAAAAVAAAAAASTDIDYAVVKTCDDTSQPRSMRSKRSLSPSSTVNPRQVKTKTRVSRTTEEMIAATTTTTTTPTNSNSTKRLAQSATPTTADLMTHDKSSVAVINNSTTINKISTTPASNSTNKLSTTPAVKSVVKKPTTHHPTTVSTRLLPDIISTPSGSTTAGSAAYHRRDPFEKLAVKIGFLGLGKLGSMIVRCLLESGHNVTVWNRTPSKCREFVALGADKGSSPADVVQTCDITISCLSDSRALRDLVCGSGGLLQDMGPGKSLVDMSTVDIDTITAVYEAVTLRGGRFLEAPVIGSLHSDTETSRQLIVVAAGDRSLYDDCFSCFNAIAKQIFFIGEVGSATCMKLVTNMLLGTMMSGIAESLALGEKVGLNQEQILQIVHLLPINSLLYKQKGTAMIQNEFNPPQLAIDHMQRDLRLAIGLAESVEQPVHVTSATNELFKRAKSRGYGDHDTAAIYRATE